MFFAFSLRLIRFIDHQPGGALPPLFSWLLFPVSTISSYQFLEQKLSQLIPNSGFPPLFQGIIIGVVGVNLPLIRSLLSLSETAIGQFFQPWPRVLGKRQGR